MKNKKILKILFILHYTRKRKKSFQISAISDLHQKMADAFKKHVFSLEKNLRGNKILRQAIADYNHRLNDCGRGEINLKNGLWITAESLSVKKTNGGIITGDAENQGKSNNQHKKISGFAESNRQYFDIRKILKKPEKSLP